MIIFQSTLPMRGATLRLQQSSHKKPNFNPHSPCGERLCPVLLYSSLTHYFNPHSPCGERPKTSALKWAGTTDFNPHSPCGERLAFSPASLMMSVFQSTLPMRGATAKVTEFTLNLKTKFMTFGTKTNCETLQSSVSRICSNEKNYISQVRISKQFMIASHSHIYKISGSSGIDDALFPKCSIFFW